jgi:cytochrome b
MNSEYQQVFVWSKWIRLFHWINVFVISALIGLGLIIFNAGAFGVSTEGKILLKTIHVLFGYVFAFNLLFRIGLAFFGKHNERWRKFLPFMKGFTQDLASFRKQPHKQFTGHNPLGKLMIGALLTCMSIQMVTGLVIAGTDIYYPPLGQYFAESIAVDKTQVALIKPYSKENVDEQAYKSMRALRSPFIAAHVYAFYALLVLIPLHILGVILSERREKTALVSAMINGYKYLSKNKQ